MTRKRKILVGGALSLGVLVPAVVVLVGLSYPTDDVKAWIQQTSKPLYRLAKQALFDLDQEAPGVGERLGLPLLQLKLSRRDVVHFEDLYNRYEDPDYGLEYYTEHNQWRKAELFYKGERYKIRIKSHGRQPDAHRAGRFISLSIKLRNKRQMFGVSRFNLIIRERLQPERHVALDLAERFGVIAQDIRPVRVQINSWSEKLYFVERRLDNVEMEARGRSSLRRFSAHNTRSLVLVSPESESDERLRSALEEVLDADGYPPAHAEAIVERYAGINGLIRARQSEGIDRYVDEDYMASYLAARLVGGFHGHGSGPTNFYAFLDTCSGLFFPALTRDDIIQPLAPSGDDWTPELQLNTIQSSRPFFATMVQNDRLRQASYRRLYAFIEANQSLISQEHLELVEHHEGQSLYGWARLLMRRVGSESVRYSAAQNLAVLKSYLEASRPLVDWDLDEGRFTLRVQPQSMSALRVARLTIPTASGPVELAERVGEREFSTGMDERGGRVTRTLSVRLPLHGVVASGPPELELKNAVTGADVEWSRAELDPTSAVALTQDSGWDQWRARYPGVSAVLRGQDLVFGAGEHRLESDVILEPGWRLVLEAGARLRLGPGRVLVGYSGMYVAGTADAPARIEALDPEQPYGSVGILGGAETRTEIQHLRQSGGSERWFGGAYFSGGLSIHHNGEVRMENSFIEGNSADDGLNVKYAESLLISNCVFRNNFADQVDLDYCNGLVVGSRFEVMTGAHSNGDGLDFSGSKMVVRDCSFTGLRDKGASVGEKSHAIFVNSRFVGNGNGAAVKDLSHTWFHGNVFSDNETDLKAYRKKKIFGGGRIYLPASSPLKPEMDKLSRTRSFDPGAVSDAESVGGDDATEAVLKLFSKLKPTTRFGVDDE